MGTATIGASDPARARTRDLSAFRLPPKIERVLGAWHTRAHQTADPIAPEDAAGSDDAVTA